MFSDVTLKSEVWNMAVVEAADQRNSSSHLRDAIYLDNENFYFHFSHTYIILSGKNVLMTA